MKKSFFIGIVGAMLLVGCDNSQETTTTNTDSVEVEVLKSSMEKQVTELQQRLDELQLRLDAVDEENGDQGLALYTLNHIINATSDVEAKYGYIESISENKVTVKRVEMVTDSSRPNGYRIDELNQNEEFLLDETMLYFVVHEVAPELVDYTEFKQQAVGSKLFTFTIVDGKLLVIKEQYLP
ncbi:MAG: hypothetical protein ABS942_13155 [Solibacillus sp.]|uniref:hypothetical protein n=1 Tax=Solibacillus sp. TaxID=1909654 RepID=UPI003315DB51